MMNEYENLDLIVMHYQNHLWFMPNDRNKIISEVYIIYWYRCHFLIINQLALLINRTANISITNQMKGLLSENAVFGAKNTEPHSVNTPPSKIISIDMNT